VDDRRLTLDCHPVTEDDLLNNLDVNVRENGAERLVEFAELRRSFDDIAVDTVCLAIWSKQPVDSTHKCEATIVHKATSQRLPLTGTAFLELRDDQIMRAGISSAFWNR